ncbi:MAG: alpha-amylase family glycosyl hydrolase [Cyanobacteriota bacterium]
MLPSFLDNRDMNRFLWLLGGDKQRLKLAAFRQFTLPLPPILYYGTEVGLSQRAGVGRLEEARLPMPWGDEQDQDLLAFFRGLIAFRQANPSLRQEPRHTWWLHDEQGGLGVRCGNLLLLFNNGPHVSTVTLPRGWAAAEPCLLTAPLERLQATSHHLELAPSAGAGLALRPG